MNLKQYVQQYTINTSNTIYGKIIEIDHYGNIMDEYYYDIINDHIQFIMNPKNINNITHWYFLQGPHNLYITLFLQDNTFINFLYKLCLLEHLTQPMKREGMWISEYNYHLYDIYDYNKKDLYVHNRLFNFALSDNKAKNIFYNKCHENFTVLTQQLNCVL